MVDHSTKASATTNIPSVRVIFVVGCPGAGKGTLCKRLAQDCGWYHLSVGDYLRDLAYANSIFTVEACGGMSPAELQAHIKEQKLIPATTIVAIVTHKVEAERKAGYDRFLVDGYPRQVNFAELFEKQVAYPSAVIFLSATKHIAKTRYLERGREHDDAAKFERRHDEFVQNNSAILVRYGGVLQAVNEMHILGRRR